MGYVWKGKPDAAPEVAVPEPTTGLRPWNPELCGTYPGYAQHKRHDVEICQDCRDANNAYNRAIGRNSDGSAKIPSTPFDDSACGTYPGYVRHTRRKLEPCDPCKAASTAYGAERREARKAAKAPRPVGVFNPAVCGDNNGYHRHVRNGTPACVPCLAGHNEHQGTERRAA